MSGATDRCLRVDQHVSDCAEAERCRHCDGSLSPRAGRTLRSLVRTCGACPEQWEGETLDGQHVYLRHRHGAGRLSIGPTLDDAVDAGWWPGGRGRVLLEWIDDEHDGELRPGALPYVLDAAGFILGLAADAVLMTAARELYEHDLRTRRVPVHDMWDRLPDDDRAALVDRVTLDVGGHAGGPPAPASWPRVAPQPASDDVVAVLMTERMARWFEARCLGPAGVHTVGATELSLPLFFREDDLPTYIVSTA